MVRLGAFLAFFGFGSALLHFTSMQFRLLMWAEPMQPALGLGLGALGVVVLVLRTALSKDKPETPAGQQFGPPPGGYAPPPDLRRGEPHFQPQQQFGPAPMPPAAGPEPVLGRPQFAPRPAGAQRPVPPPQFPPQGPPYGQPPQQFGPRGGAPFGPQG